MTSRASGLDTGKQRQGRHVPGPNDPEVAMIECRHVAHAKTLRQRYHGRIGRPQQQVRVRSHKLRSPAIVSTQQVHWREVPIG